MKVRFLNFLKKLKTNKNIKSSLYFIISIILFFTLIFYAKVECSDTALLDSSIVSKATADESFNNDEIIIVIPSTCETTTEHVEENTIINESNVMVETETEPTEIVESEEIANDEPQNNNDNIEGDNYEENYNERTPLSSVIYTDVRIPSNLTAEELE